MSALWLLASLAGATPPEGSLFEPIRTELGGGAVVDWTTVRLLVTAPGRKQSNEGTAALEELTRRAIDLRVTTSVLDVPIAPDKSYLDLQQDPTLWAKLEPRVHRWVEVENRYYASGRIELVGALSLVDLLKPLTMATATASQGAESAHTGALLDARGSGARPCFAPVITDPEGTVLYDGKLWVDAAVERAPAVWVSDAAHPAVERAGASPIVGRVAAAEGCRLAVDLSLAAPVAELAQVGRLAEGTLVIVVDP